MAITFVICNVLFYFFNFDIGKIGDKEFLFNFFGILLGFSITIFAFIMSMIDKMRERLEGDPLINKEKANRFNRVATNVYSEVKEDIYFTFASLIIIATMYVFQKIKIPPFHIFGNFYFDRSILSRGVKLSLFILNLLAIYDLIIVSFRISDTTALIETKNE